MSDQRDDAELLAAFEDCSISLAQWTHRAHVRVAWLYLSRHGLAEAAARMRRGLLALNAAHQVPDALDRGYHETITLAFLRLIGARIACGPVCHCSPQFCAANSDLLEKKALLLHYTRERLMSAEAKRAFVEPDLAPLR